MIELQLAWRYLRPRRNALSVITLLCFLGVMLGVTVLLVVLAVMTGFTSLMKEKLVETQAHFQITAPGNYVIRSPQQAVRAAESAGARAAAVIQTPVLAQFGRRQLDTQILLFGVKEKALKEQLQLDGKIREGHFTLANRSILVSSAIASRWGASVGDKVILHSARRLTGLVKFGDDGTVEFNRNAAYVPMEFRIAGVYSMGKYDFDKLVVFTDIDDAAELLDLPWGSATAVFGWSPDAFHQGKVITAVRASLPSLVVTTWEENNRQLLSVLATEKNMMYFLLVFIVLVAAFSICNTLIASTAQKTREIGLLKALGASDGQVARIFLFQGFLTGVTGSAAGIALGLLVLHFRNDILHFTSEVLHTELFPKEFYFFDGLPAQVLPVDVAVVAVSAVLLCTLGALLPALRAAHTDPAEALRYE